MPQVVGAAILSAIGEASVATATAFTIAGTAVTWGAIVGEIAIVGASVAYSSAQASRMRRANSQAAFADSGRNIMSRDPIAPRRKIYGQVPVTGPMYPIGVTGSKGEYFHFIVLLAGHKCAELGDITFDDDPTEIILDSGGNATGKYSGYVKIVKHDGDAAQAADADLISAFPGTWTSDHRGAGVAYLYVRLKYSTDLFPNGLPAIKCTVKGALVYDPRDEAQDPDDASTWAWSDNAALCTADFLNDAKFGKGIPLARIPAAALIEAANICDEDVVLTDDTTEHRYTCHGTITADQDKNVVLGDLAAAMAGVVVDTGGVWTIRAGAWRTPELALGDGDLAGPLSVQPRMSRQDTYNGVKGVFISPVNNWQPGDFPPQKNDTYKTKDGGVRLWKDIALNFTTSSPTAQRLAKIDLERGRQQITFTALYKLKSIAAMPGDVVTITRERLGWTDKPFEVTGWELQIYDGVNGGKCLGVALTLRETAEAVWDWADGEETVDDLAPNTDLPDPFTVPTPSGLTLTSGASTVLIQQDGTAVPRILVAWSTPDNIHVESGGKVRIEYKPSAGSTWFVWSEQRGDTLADYITDVVIGVDFDVRIQFENNVGVRGDYATASNHTVAGDTTAPSALSAPSATAYPGYNRIAWSRSDDADASEYRIYRNTSNTTAGATLLGETSGLEWDDPSATPGTTYWYFVAVVDGSENEGSKSSGKGVTTALAPVGATTPANPTAATRVTAGSDDTYLSGDGAVFAFITIAVPALPNHAVWQNLLYRRDGATDWLVAAQLKNTGSTNVRLDDLTPGVSYEVATQAWSGAGGSSIVTATSSPFTAPNDSAAPSAPAGLAYVGGGSSSFLRAPVYQGQVRAFAVRVNWDISSDADFDHFDVVVNLAGASQASNTAAWALLKQTTTGTEYIAVSTIPTNAETFVRSVDRSGNKSSWVGGGTMSSIWGLPAGSMSEQDDDAVSVSGIETGASAASGVRQVLARYPFVDLVYTFAGGAPTESFSLDIGTRGFSAVPDVATAQCIDPAGDVEVAYDWTAANSSTTVWFKAYSKDSTNIGAGPRRFSGEVVEYF